MRLERRAMDMKIIFYPLTSLRPLPQNRISVILCIDLYMYKYEISLLCVLFQIICRGGRHTLKKYGRPEGVDPELKEILAKRKIFLKRCVRERERRVNRLWEGRKGDLCLHHKP